MSAPTDPPAPAPPASRPPADARPAPPPAALAPARAGRRAAAASAALVLLVSAAHLLVAGRVGLGTDEAHYALYGLHLDWSYFDHPPLTGWLSALTQTLLGTSDLALRVPAIVLMAVVGLLLHRLVRTLFPHESPWTATLSVALWQGTLVGQLLGLALIPELPLMLAALLALLALHAVLRRDDRALGPWCALGLALGAAGLSKYTAVLLVPSVLLALLVERRLRALARPGPWLAAALAAVCVSPVLLWNHARDWISFRYQLDHGAGGSEWSATSFLGSQLAPLLAYAPAVVVFGVAGVLAARREWRAQRGVRLLLLTALPPLLVFAAASGREFTLPHWTALGWLLLTPLAARWLRARWSARWVRVLAWSSGAWSLLLVLVIHTHLHTPWLPLPDWRRPLAAVSGWDAAARRALELQADMAATPGPPPRLFSDNWARTARLAWYARPEPVIVLDRRRDQFDLWYGDPEPGDRGVLVVWIDDPEDRERPPRDARQFAQHELLDEQEVIIDGRVGAVFRFFACRGHPGGSP